MSKELIKYSELFIVYKSLFTKKQYAYLNEYFINDKSFSEVATQFHVSTMAVHDAINRCKKQLLDYEHKLCLYDKKQTRLSLYKKIKDTNLKNKLIRAN
jgi:predicted DNA-binding protein YlxM (UPF0122 family)